MEVEKTEEIQEETLAGRSVPSLASNGGTRRDSVHDRFGS